MWAEVKQAREENRYELVLTGEDVNEKIEKEGQLDPALFDLVNLNFLRVSGTPLVTLSEDIGKVTNITNLILQGNKLQSLPDSIGSLQKLKLLDVSMNCLECLPCSISKLSCLTSLNASGNRLQLVPNLETCVNLNILNLRENILADFPEVCHQNMAHLSEIRLGTNQLTDVPSSLAVLPSLKLLDISDNRVKAVPGELMDCLKLKELHLKGNPLSDRRFKKLVEAERCIPRQVLDYVRQHCPKISADGGKQAAKGKKGKGKGKNKEKDEVEELCDEVHVLSVKETWPVVRVESSVKAVRSYIVCCILQGVDLKGENMKRFLSAQTKLHDGVCEKRMAATIATHDLVKIIGPLRYLARPPEDIRIYPLVRGKEVSARELYQGLQQEAEVQRKHQKRNNVTGIHKFLHLVERWAEWPCLMDASGTVISLPPITNSENTKITSTTTDVFVEVTSGASLTKAKEVMNALVLAALTCGLTSENASTDNEGLENSTLQAVVRVGQVRIEDEEGALRVLYPSRVDLVDQASGIRVVMPAK